MKTINLKMPQDKWLIIIFLWALMLFACMAFGCSGDDAPSHAECERLLRARESAQRAYNNTPNADTRKAYEDAQRAYNDKCK